MSKVYVGAEFVNNQGSRFVIVSKCAEPRYWVVRFDSGFVATAKDTNIPYGKVKDYYKPSVYGVGYIGSAMRIPARESGTLVRRVYDVWANMLKRTYGAYTDHWNADYSDVQVCAEWHNFTFFLQDIQRVPGYEAWLQDSTICLDKDLARGRLYSRSTCKFITNVENLSEASLRRWHG